VKILLANDVQVNAQGKEYGRTALMWAAAEKRPDMVQALIEGDADVHLRSSEGFDALMLAARVGDVASAELLIGAGANLNEQGPQGMTALVLAAFNDQQPVGLLLLEKSADANARDEYGATALHYALIKGIGVLNGARYADDVSALFRPSETALVEALLRHGANPNVQLDKAPPLGGTGSPAAVGATPFLLAAATHDLFVMRLLADAGADPNIPTITGLSPLMVAAGAGRAQDFTEDEKLAALEAVKLAVELGADVSAMNEDGLTALHAAAAKGADQVVQFLIARGARVDVRDKYQRTPLSIAAGERLPWIPDGRRLSNMSQPSTRDLLLKLGATPLDTPGYFAPPGEPSQALHELGAP
jgi:ankyrin repeat protein